MFIRIASSYTGVSLKFLIVGETNSMVGYHLMTEGQSIQLEVSGGTRCCELPSRSLTIDLRKMFEKLAIDTFYRRNDKYEIFCKE